MPGAGGGYRRNRSRHLLDTPFPGGYTFTIKPIDTLQRMDTMLVIHVHVHVKSECVAAFLAATVENARNSVLERGIARFDVVQQADDPTRFVLIEAYRTADAPAAHKETTHYLKWRDAVADMMAEPRSSVKYANVYPEDAEW